MGTLTSFFGGGGATSPVTTSANPRLKNLTYLNTTVLSPGASPAETYVVPFSGNKFLIHHTGGYNTQGYFRLFEIADDGTVSTVAPTSSWGTYGVNGATHEMDNLCGAANGSTTAIVPWFYTSTNTYRCAKLIWDGSTGFSVSSNMHSVSSPSYSLTSVGCTADNMLLSVSMDNSKSMSWRAVDTDGNHDGQSFSVNDISTESRITSSIPMEDGYYFAGHNGSSQELLVLGSITRSDSATTLSQSFVNDWFNIGIRGSVVYQASDVRIARSGTNVVFYKTNQQAQNSPGRFIIGVMADRGAYAHITNQLGTSSDNENMTDNSTSDRLPNMIDKGNYTRHHNGTYTNNRQVVEFANDGSTIAVSRPYKNPYPRGVNISEMKAQNIVGNYLVQVNKDSSSNFSIDVFGLN